MYYEKFVKHMEISYIFWQMNEVKSQNACYQLKSQSTQWDVEIEL